MACHWVIVEDKPQQAISLAVAIRNNAAFKSDRITYIYPTANPIEEYKRRLEDELSVNVYLCPTSESIVEEFERNQMLASDNLLLLLDVYLPGIVTVQDYIIEPTHIIPKLWIGLSQAVSRQNLIMVYSTDYNHQAVADALGGAPKACSTTLHASGTKGATDICQESIRYWNALYSGDTKLERLWNLSEMEKWFSCTSINTPHEMVQLHSIDSESEVTRFMVNNPAGITAFRQSVEKGIGFCLPTSWLESTEATVINVRSVAQFNASLKSICGMTFRGCGGQTHLRLGGVFLIAMLAYSDAMETGSATPEIFAAAIRDWTHLPFLNSNFLSDTDPDSARRICSLLYRLFYELFRHHQNKTASAPLKKVFISEEGRCLKFIFEEHLEHKWIGSGLALKLFSAWNPSLTEQSSEVDRVLRLPAQCKNVTDIVCWLTYKMMHNDDGFSHPGHIHLEKDILRVGTIGP